VSDRLLRGAGRYTDDAPRAGASHGVFVRAPHAHARIVALDMAEARAMPGVIAVLSAADLALPGGFPAISPPMLPPGALLAPRRPALAEGVVRFVGEAVALAVAHSRAAAEDAAEAVRAQYAELAVTPVAALSPALPDHPDLHAGIPGNIAMDAALGDIAAVEARLAAAAHVARASIILPRLAPSPMEPRSALAWWDGAAGLHHLHTQHQGVPEMIAPLALVLGVERGSIRVHAGDVGGAFGARGAAVPEHAALMAAARALGRAIHWQGTRTEGFLTDPHGRGTALTGRLGIDAEGRFTALAVELEADLGAYATPVGALIHVKNTRPCLTGAYDIAEAVLHVRQRYTNAAPIGPYRGAGRPDIACLVERLADEAARLTGRDRIALRRANLAPPAPARGSGAPALEGGGEVTPEGGAKVTPEGGAKVTPEGGEKYDGADFAGLLDRGLDLADWDGFAARASASAARGLRRGIGAALFVEVAGGGAAPHDEARLSLRARNGALHVEARVLGQASGQGHARALARLVAGALGCAAGDVAVVSDDGGAGLAGSGSFGSRSMTAMGSALIDAAGQARTAALAMAAEMLGRDDLDLAQGEIRADGRTLATLAAVIETAMQGEILTLTGAAPLAETFPAGCHIAEVEIDPETGALTVARYAAVDDCGAAIDPASVHGQLHGAIAQGLGEALCEAIRYDLSGQLLSASFMDYALPRADMIPDLKVTTWGAPSPATPTGARGVGEAGVAGALGALVNAVDHALGGAGRAAIPFTPANLRAALAR
jgi:carbon-monoxide dehydrogenase large subunit